MALPPLLVNQTRWSDLLKQLAVLKGLDHVELLAELRACLVLENDRPEHKYLAGEALACGQYLFAAPGVGVISYVGLRNPSGSGKILIVEEALAIVADQSANYGRVYLMLARGGTMTARSTEQPRDTRIQPSGAFGTAAPGIVGQMVSAVNTDIGVVPFAIAELLTVNSLAATSFAANQARSTQPFVLAPNDSLLFSVSDGIGGNETNLQLQVSMFWRERTLEPTET